MAKKNSKIKNPKLLRYGYRYEWRQTDQPIYRYIYPLQEADGQRMGACWIVDKNLNIAPDCQKPEMVAAASLANGEYAGKKELQLDEYQDLWEAPMAPTPPISQEAEHETEAPSFLILPPSEGEKANGEKLKELFDNFIGTAFLHLQLMHSLQKHAS